MNQRGIEFQELALNEDITGTALQGIAAPGSIPQVFINGQHIGSSEYLDKWLEPLVAQNSMTLRN